MADQRPPTAQPQPASSPANPPWGRTDLLWLAGCLLLAAALRLPRLDLVPPGFQFDETYNALDALRIVAGERPLFLPANAGREVLYSYWQAPLVAALGPTAVAIRLASALVGIVTVPLLYLWVRLLFPDRGQRLAGLSALVLAVCYPHLHFSRYGIRSITIPFWMLLTFGALWEGLRDRRPAAMALCGMGLAAMVWTHPVGRLMPFLVLAPTLYLAWSDRRHAGFYAGGLAIAGAVALVLFLPLGRYYLAHPSHFVGHASDVSVFDPRVHRGNLLSALIENALRVASMFTFAGDREWIHNLPGRPVFDPLLSAAFLLGSGVAVRTVVRRGWGARAILLTAWFVGLLMPSLLSDMAPNFSRTIAVLPLAALLAGQGLDTAATWVSRRGYGRLVPPGLALALMVGGAWTTWDYFLRFGLDPRTPYHYDRDKIEAAHVLREAAARDEVFLAPLWAQQATIQLLARDVGLRSVEADAATVWPARDGQRGLLYAFPPEQGGLADALAQRWGVWANREVAYDGRGEVLLHLVHLAAAARPVAGEGAPWIARPDQPQRGIIPTTEGFGPLRLLGYRLADGYVEDGSLPLTLVWEARAAIAEDLTVFVHLVDDSGRRWGQADGRPGRDSAPTTAWHIGDVMVDERRLALDPCTPAGSYHLEVGWYNLASGARLPSDAGMPLVRLGPVEVGPPPCVAPEVLAAEGILVDRDIARGLHLLTVGLPETTWELGRPVELSLHWLAQESSAELAPIRLVLAAANDEETRLVETVPGGDPTGPWPAGSARCQLLRLRVTDTPLGHYRLRLSAAAGAVGLAEIDLVPSNRRFEVPGMRVPLGAALRSPDGGAIRLLGYDLPGIPSTGPGTVEAAPGDTLELTLHWQLLQPLGASYTVFCHLVDETHAIVAQRDTVPLEGSYPITEWAPGEVVSDRYVLTLPADAKQGRYALLVGLYDPATGARLAADPAPSARGDHVALPSEIWVR